MMAEVILPSLGDPSPGVHSSSKLSQPAQITLTGSLQVTEGNLCSQNLDLPDVLSSGSCVNLPNGCVRHPTTHDKLSKPMSKTLKDNQSNCRSFDSGLGSDSLSDSKSNSSSPGISTACSNQDFGQENKLHCDAASEALNQQTVCEASVSQISDRLSSTNISDNKDNDKDVENDIEYVVYESEVQMPDIMRLITKDLSEPYSIYTYRYFIHNWPKLCFLAMEGNQCVGAIVCKLDLHKKMVRRGYIAMLAIDQSYRRKGIGSHLVLKAIKAMIADDCDEVVLETEITNKAALHFYENLGFVHDKRLFRYYLNGVDALRLKLWLR